MHYEEHENTVVPLDINPRMGCNGCELWKPAAAIVAILLTTLMLLIRKPKTAVKQALARVVGHRTTSELYQDREQVAADLAARLSLTREQQGELVDVVRRECKCYAGLLGTFRAGHKGYADKFETPKLYPGRMAMAARWDSPDEKDRQGKPWLNGLPRLIFISDMGDALSAPVPVDYLRSEIIENAVSKDGRRHLWLWLTKRHGRWAIPLRAKSFGFLDKHP
jgi:hypothetical protein